MTTPSHPGRRGLCLLLTGGRGHPLGVQGAGESGPLSRGTELLLRSPFCLGLCYFPLVSSQGTPSYPPHAGAAKP